MSNVNRELKHIFIHIPKCAGSSMEACPPWSKGSGHRTLKDFSVDLKGDLSSYYKWCFVRNPWDRAVSAWDTCPEIKPHLPTFPKFVEALYRDRKRMQNLPECRWSNNLLGGQGHETVHLPVQRIHFLPMLAMMKVDGVMGMDFVGRFENIQNDWKRLCNIAFGKRIDLPTHNQRPDSRIQVDAVQTELDVKRTYYKNYYTHPDLIGMVGEVYKEDVEAFKYSYD